MDVPLNAEVRCAGHLCGLSVALVFNPITEQVTHIVVREQQAPRVELLVPLDLVVETAPQRIELRDTAETLGKMEPFIETQFLRARLPYTIPTSSAYIWPFVLAEEGNALVPLEHERIPVGEEAIRRGAAVHATDGVVGKVGEFLVDSTSGYITHLVLHAGHLWGQRDVTIPVAQIDRIEESAVYLKLSKEDIRELPSIPIRREHLEEKPMADFGNRVAELGAGPETPATGPSEIEELVAALADKHGARRHEARLRLVAIGSPAIAPLTETLADANDDVRWEATKALGEIGDQVAIPALLRMLEDVDFGVRWLAAEGLIRMGSAALGPLFRLLIAKSDSRWVRNGAHHILRVLGTQGLHDEVAPVLAALSDVEPVVEVPLAARTALDALSGEVNDERTVE